MTTATLSPTAQPRYPVHVDGATTPTGSRWLWLVKWLLVIPHIIVLTVLWIAFAVLSIVAFVAILVTGHYPRALFEFNAGVLRWSWRVSYYAYGALGTDRYPPFTLAEVPDYPAHFEVDYPEHLSRGLVLVKWWLLALPHYVVVGLLVGTGSWIATDDTRWRTSWGEGGLIGLLVLVAAVALGVTGTYPRPLWDLVLGLNRWVLRVAAYAALMTDAYPPFRLDLGPHEPDVMASLSPDPAPPTGPAPSGAAPMTAAPAGAAPMTAAPLAATPVAAPTPSTPTAAAPRPGWTPGRTVAVVLGALVSIVALTIAVGGGALLVADRTMRHDGYVTVLDRPVDTAGYAVAATSLDLQTIASGNDIADRVLGRMRIQVTRQGSGPDVFVGIAPSADVERYLSGVARTVPGRRASLDRDIAGAAPSTPPTALDTWVARATGSPGAELSWSPRNGDWGLVVMNADGSAALSANVVAGAELPWLGTAGTVLLVVGLLVLALGVVMVSVAVHRASTRPAAQP
ncbi:DUF4389 domain-containing protein [Pedococcus sp. 2YAF34]|uniref:DUF4389 domain-containing protein n=1 Tax=Pedococcus sp. 2YAF34 TaxID=3233032 RepID=UPI003F9AEBA1